MAAKCIEQREGLEAESLSTSMCFGCFDCWRDCGACCKSSVNGSITEISIDQSDHIIYVSGVSVSWSLGDCSKRPTEAHPYIDEKIFSV